MKGTWPIVQIIAWDLGLKLSTKSLSFFDLSLKQNIL